MSGERDGIPEPRVSEAVTTLNGRGIIMVPETAEHGEHLEEEEESVIVPTTVPAFVNSKEDCQPYTDDNVSRCGNSVDRTVGEQLLDIIQSSYSVNEGIPSAGCESHHKKVSPEEPRSLESTNLCPDNLSSPCLGDEIDVNNISENNTSELELSDSSQKSENVGKKRKLSTEEIDPQERKVSKRTRTMDVVTDCVDYGCYNYLMQRIRKQYLPKIPELFMFGVKFRTPFKLELESKSDYPKLIEALDRGVQIDAEADETNVDKSTIYEDNSSTDHTKITNCSEADKLETDENISFTLTSCTKVADINSITDREMEETIQQERCLSSDVNETRHCSKTMINKRIGELGNNNKERDKSNKNKEETWKLSEAGQAVKTGNIYDRDEERYNIIANSQYSDISEDEDDSPILNLSTKRVTGNNDGSHIDTPPPGFHHPEVYYNTQAKGGTSCNPKKGKQSKKRMKKISENNARPSVCKDIPPEIDKGATEAASDKTVSYSIPTLRETEEVQTPFGENFRRLLADVVHNRLYEIEKQTVKPILPNFEYIEAENSQNEHECIDHEEVKQKLNKKVITKMKSEGKYVPRERSSVLRMVEVKTEGSDHFVPAIEEDPDATLPGGMIVIENIEDYSNMPSD